MLRYFNFEPSFKLRWCRDRDLFGSQIPVTTRFFELQISYIRSSYLTTRPKGLIGGFRKAEFASGTRFVLRIRLTY